LSSQDCPYAKVAEALIQEEIQDSSDTGGDSSEKKTRARRAQNVPVHANSVGRESFTGRVMSRKQNAFLLQTSDFAVSVHFSRSVS
jgi:hypothetical protein